VVEPNDEAGILRRDLGKHRLPNPRGRAAYR
jgi:hypothetical protein